MKVIKSILLVLFFSLFLNCYSQQMNQKVVEENGKEKLLGKVDKSAFLKDSFANWFRPAFSQYELDTVSIGTFKGTLDDLKIMVFMGTWCGDSKRELPRFYKILETAAFPMDQLTVIAVDYVKPNYKKSPGGEEKGRNIVKVPTFIFYKEGVEINRIIESPVVTLEKDIAAIVSGQPYTPNYSKVKLVPMD